VSVSSLKLGSTYRVAYGGGVSEQVLGLRELKKRQTRQAISDVATRLFIDRGFDEVTITEVAAAARVAKMTVTNHFPRKEDLVFDVHENLITAPARAVAERLAGESVLEALRRSYLEALARRDPLIGFAGRPFVRMVAASPTLQARLREIHDEREKALAEVLADAMGTNADDITTLVVAAQFASAYRLLFEEAQRRILAGADNDTVASALDDAARRICTLLEPGLMDYGRQDGS
jgi:AcrR family transcriptional regulator